MSLPVVEQNLHFLRQGAALLRSLDDDIYARPTSDRPRAAGVGPHFRHCLDFYRCFLRDLEGGRIDYDARDRQPELETSILTALASVESIIADLDSIDEEQAQREVTVHHDGFPGEELVTSWQRSTVARELRFLASHTVHHFALIAHLAREQGVEPGDEFGVAPATLEFWAAQEAH